MQRWHSERNLMMRRWRKELATHTPRGSGFGFMPHEAMVPASYACDVECHCANGMGTMRKRRLDGHSHYCNLCDYHKRDCPGAANYGRANVRLAAIDFDMRAYG